MKITIKEYIALALAAGVTMLLVGALWESERLILGDYLSGNPAFRRRFWVEVYILCHPLFFGWIFAAGFVVVVRRLSEPIGVQFGLRFGLFVFLVGSLPIFVLFGIALAVPAKVVPFWALRNLTQYCAAGAVLSWLWSRQVGRTPYRR